MNRMTREDDPEDRGSNEWDEDWDDDFDSAIDDGDSELDEGTVSCPYCGAAVFEDAEWCPHCENYISQEDAPTGQSKPAWIWVVLFLILGTFIYSVTLMN